MIGLLRVYPVPIIKGMATLPTRRALLCGLAGAVSSQGTSVATVGVPAPSIPLDAGLSPRLRSLWQRALGEGTKSPSPAVIVSKEQWDNLPPLRGWRDEKFLVAYLDWADRPEAAGFTEEQSAATIFADTGKHDWVLLRRPFGQFQCDAINRADPLGFTLIKPSPGWNRIRLTPSPKPGALEAFQARFAELSIKPIPDIGLVQLVSSASNGNVITIYGTGFEGGKIEVVSESGAGEILYASPTQINARVPSLTRVRVAVDGESTIWMPIHSK
jgi:hypothetical protein